MISSVVSSIGMFSCNLQPGLTHKYLHKLVCRFGSYTKLMAPTNEII